MPLRPLIIDCDPGADDAIALFLTFASHHFDVLAVTTVAGNVPLSLTQRNARIICELAKRADVPVYAGCPRPLLRSLVTAEEVHGQTGLDGVDLPEPTMPLQAEHAVNFLIQQLMQAEEPVTLATLGPLTNLAVALIQQPVIREKIQEVVVMGGSMTQGNVTPSAEFNIYADPHAAHVVFNAELPLTMIGLDVTHQAIATPERMQTIREIGNSVSQIAIGLLDHYGKFDMARYGTPGPFLHDPCVIAYLLRPDLFDGRKAAVEVEITSNLTIGRTVVNQWNSSEGHANAFVVTEIDADGFYQELTKALASY